MDSVWTSTHVLFHLFFFIINNYLVSFISFLISQIIVNEKEESKQVEEERLWNPIRCSNPEIQNVEKENEKKAAYKDEEEE